MLNDIITAIFNKYRVIVTFNTTYDILFAVGIFVVTFVALHIFKFVVVKRARVLARKTEAQWDDDFVDMIYNVGPLFYLLFPLILAINHLTFTPQGEDTLELVTFIVTIYYVISLGQIFFVQLIRQIINFEQEETDNTFNDFLEIIVKVVLWTFALIFVLKSLDYSITAVLGSLGIAGVAVAFALKNILADIIAYFTLYFDKPFTIGDYISVGTEAESDRDKGTVKAIGIKSVRLETLEGQELVVPNQVVTNSRVTNFTRYISSGRKRLSLTFGVEYETPMNKLRRIPSMVVEIADNIDDVELNRVNLKELTPSSIDYDAVFLIDSDDYIEYREFQQKINLALLKKLREESINLSYPARTVYLRQNESK